MVWVLDVSGRPWWRGESSFFGALVPDLEARSCLRPSGRPWRRGEGGGDCSVLSIWRKLGMVLAAGAIELRLVACGVEILRDGCMVRRKSGDGEAGASAK